jgi:hypothetical protein
MAALQFPLFVLREADTESLVSEASQGQVRLALFTSAELAHGYCNSASRNLQVTKLSEPDQLRQVLAECRDKTADFAIVMDP